MFTTCPATNTSSLAPVLYWQKTSRQVRVRIHKRRSSDGGASKETGQGDADIMIRISGLEVESARLSWVTGSIQGAFWILLRSRRRHLQAHVAKCIVGRGPQTRDGY